MRFFLVDGRIPAYEPEPGKMLSFSPSTMDFGEISPEEVLGDPRSPEISADEFKELILEAGASLPEELNKSSLVFDYDKKEEMGIASAQSPEMKDIIDSLVKEKKEKELREKLHEYPNTSDEIVEQQILQYEQREYRKKTLMIERGMSNLMAEKFLEIEGWPRPPGWHSVFFYPESNTPRGRIWFWIIVIICGAFYFILS